MDLPPAPTGVRRFAGRGLPATANAGPSTNGSQFVIVYGISAPRPDYTVFGTVGAAGLKALDKIAAGGIEPTSRARRLSTPCPCCGPTAQRPAVLPAVMNCGAVTMGPAMCLVSR
ncbi:peptidylprolyl isomerase [Streptomyces sp. NPDC001507]|uniref:peptidylprolyl isomerase n=1 Tax=Streptomyces sp. NPDC001507 TaxID=3364579 RepID=UPI0036B0901E